MVNDLRSLTGEHIPEYVSIKVPIVHCGARSGDALTSVAMNIVETYMHAARNRCDFITFPSW